MEKIAIDLDYNFLAQELEEQVESVFIVVYRINQNYPKPFLELLWNTNTQSLPNCKIEPVEPESRTTPESLTTGIRNQAFNFLETKLMVNNINCLPNFKGFHTENEQCFIFYDVTECDNIDLM